MKSDWLGYMLTGLIIAGSLLAARLLGIEISWKLLVLIIGTGCMTETACSIYHARRSKCLGTGTS